MRQRTGRDPVGVVSADAAGSAVGGFVVQIPVVSFHPIEADPAIGDGPDDALRDVVDVESDAVVALPRSTKSAPSLHYASAKVTKAGPSGGTGGGFGGGQPNSGGSDEPPS